MKCRISLEPAAEMVSEASSKPPFIFELPPETGRQMLEETQDQPVFMYPAEIASYMVNTGTWGRIPMYLVTPECVKNPADVIFYTHGAGWVFGSFHTHEKLVRELAARTGCIVVFPEYSRSPEVHFPVAVEQCFSVLFYLQQMLDGLGIAINPDTMTVAGDSVGGNLAIVMTLLAKYRGGPKIQKQLLYYPVTNACFDTETYCEFAEGYYLYRQGMKWFWDQYAPNLRDRTQVTVSPLCAACEQLKGLPEAMIINGEADVLRAEGEAYATALRCAGVPVTAIRFQAMIHDFVMLHSLDQTNACRAAMDVSTAWICRHNAAV